MNQDSTEAALAAWQATQRARGGYTEAELEELTDHLRLSAANLLPTDAERIRLAAERIADGAELTREFERVRGVRLGALVSSPAGLMTLGALLWMVAGGLMHGVKLNVTSAALSYLPGAPGTAILIGYVASLGVAALLAVLLASERRARAIGDDLRTRPLRLVAICSAMALLAFVFNLAGSSWLARVADLKTHQNALTNYGGSQPWLAALSLIPAPLLLFLASRRAVQRAATSQH